jgi:hypothetical protein
MDSDAFDIYPISHNGRVYNIITGMDMTFREVRAMLDWLDANGAFPSAGEEREPMELYSCPAEGYVFEVDVQGYEVIVYRRAAAE